MNIIRNLFIAIIITVIFLYIQNNLIQVSKIQLVLNNIPKGFDGYRIVHLSDLHGKVFFRGNNILITKIRNAKPDLIVITGDLIDYGFYNEESIKKLLHEIKKIAPIYYVTGNHDISSPEYVKLQKVLKEEGANILRNSTDKIQVNGEEILIIGIDDPIETSIKQYNKIKRVLEKDIKDALLNKNKALFKILLSHRPEQFPLYAEYGMDLSFTGHAHGGQIRIPFVGGLVAPSQGFFPKYTSGKYVNGNSIMIVSRGLGNGSFPLRFFNLPEIVVVTLKRENIS